MPWPHPTLLREARTSGPQQRRWGCSGHLSPGQQCGKLLLYRDSGGEHVDAAGQDGQRRTSVGDDDAQAGVAFQHSGDGVEPFVAEVHAAVIGAPAAGRGPNISPCGASWRLSSSSTMPGSTTQVRPAGSTETTPWQYLDQSMITAALHAWPASTLRGTTTPIGTWR
jgi:hypothetical protein